MCASQAKTPVKRPVMKNHRKDCQDTYSNFLHVFVSVGKTPAFISGG